MPGKNPSDGSRAPARRGAGAPGPRKLPVTRKLGWGGVLHTVVLNPHLGRKYRTVLDALHAGGHELGLHGGADHAAWQYGLDDLGETGLERLFRPAFEDFRMRYGSPAGFASPGFRFNESVLALLDREGFAYASDMSGETPFRPERSGGHAYRHFQVPVNVMGEDNVPLIEQGLARNHSFGRIVHDAVERIRVRRFALMYGHPYVEGVRWRLLEAVFEEARRRLRCGDRRGVPSALEGKP